MRRLETARLLLRPLVWDDFDELHRLVYADPEVAPFFTNLRTPDEVRPGFAAKVAQEEGRPGWLAVTLRDGGALIGQVALQPWEPDEPTDFLVFEHPEDALRRDPAVLEAELSYAFGRPYWGQGYAAEACRAVLDHGFGELGLARVVSSIAAANTRSIHLAERLGCRIQRNMKPSPTYGPGVIAVLDKADWRP